MIGEQIMPGVRITEAEKMEKSALQEETYGRMVSLVDAAEARGVNVSALRRGFIDRGREGLSLDYRLSALPTNAEDPALAAALNQEYLNYALKMGGRGIEEIIRFGVNLKKLAGMGDEARASIVEHNSDYEKFFDTLKKAETHEAIA